MLSLILCSRDRRDLVRRFLEHAAGWQDPGVEWELLVVDNGSSDGTGPMAETLGAELGLPVRVVREERAGHTFARNAGIRGAAGDLLAFTDHDVEPEAGWLAALVRAASRPDRIAFGGRVIPRWLGPAPAWLTTEGPFRITGGAVLEYDHGDRERDCDEGMFVPVGACMFFKREMFERFGEFREDLGRQGSALISADETEMFFRAREAGVPVRYVPSVVVHHPVDPDRMTREYHRRWYWDLGRSYARWKREVTPGRQVFGFPGSALRQVAADAGRYAGALITGPAAARWFRELRLRAALGQAFEARRLRRERRQ